MNFSTIHASRAAGESCSPNATVRGRGDWRAFRVDRLRLRSPNGPRFTPREPPGDSACVLSAGSNSLDEPAMWVARLGVPFEVHEPPELVEHIRALGARLTDAARRHTPT
ncbi:WYL domain-containing protein [Microbispora sp. NPDC046933]|uniref:WYL domain-containing protein n=1 Tax=Microbispora sp. NPDC046933 TaxID=3155618 RepID=UPI0033C0E82D